MTPVAEIIGQHLKDQGHFNNAFPLYYNFLPDQKGVPDSCASLTDSGGKKDGRYMEDGTNVFHFGLQLRIRHLQAKEALDKILVVTDYLATLKNMNIGNHTIWNVTQETPPLFMGLEEGTKRRSHYTVNFLVTLEE